MPPQTYHQPSFVAERLGVFSSDSNRALSEDFSLTEDESKNIEKFIFDIMNEMKHTHIDRYETEDGVIANLDLSLTPPTRSNLIFRTKESDGSFTFVLKGLGILIKADLDPLFKTITGHVELSIKNLDIDLRVKPTTSKGEKAMQIYYNLHLKDADIQMDLKALSNSDDLPPEIKDGPLGLLSNFKPTYKLTASGILNDPTKGTTQNVINQFLGKSSGDQLLQISEGHKVTLVASF